jgi:hypothetical protein
MARTLPPVSLPDPSQCDGGRLYRRAEHDSNWAAGQPPSFEHDATQLVCVVWQLTLQASSVHLATQLVWSVSQLAMQAMSPPRPCWLTVGFSTFAVHAIPAKRHDAAKIVAND